MSPMLHDEAGSQPGSQRGHRFPGMCWTMRHGVDTARCRPNSARHFPARVGRSRTVLRRSITPRFTVRIRAPEPNFRAARRGGGPGVRSRTRLRSGQDSNWLSLPAKQISRECRASDLRHVPRSVQLFTNRPHRRGSVDVHLATHEISSIARCASVSNGCNCDDLAPFALSLNEWQWPAKTVQ